MQKGSLEIRYRVHNTNDWIYQKISI